MRESQAYVHARPRGQHVIDEQIFTFLCHWQLKLGVIICSFSRTWLLMQESREWGWVAEVPAGSGGSKQGYKFNTNRHFSASRTFLLEVGATILSDISRNRCVTSWKLLCLTSLLLLPTNPSLAIFHFSEHIKYHKKIFPFFFSFIDNILQIQDKLYSVLEV